MPKYMGSYKTINEYVDSLPDNLQNLAHQMWQAIREAAPEAQERIAYGIPTFTINGKNLVHFAVYETHVGFYPGSMGIADFATELKTYSVSKGTVRFPLDQKLPLDLVQKITLHCAQKLSSK